MLLHVCAVLLLAAAATGSQCCQHCEHMGHCHNHCNMTTSSAACKLCAKHESLQWCESSGPSPSPSPPPPGPSPPSPGKNVTITDAIVSFYGSKDNCPPGGDIAHPSKRHPFAGGVGTAEDPATFASEKKALPPGTVVYVTALQKYFIMEDDCEECAKDWKKHKKYHTDLWIGPDKVPAGPFLIECEDALDGGSEIIINPVMDLPVNPYPLFQNDTCL